MQSIGEKTTYVLKFGSFFLAHEGADCSSLSDAEVKDLAGRTSTALIGGARSSPIVTRVIDEGIPEECWWFDIEDEGRQGTAVGLLGHVLFEAAWPSANWPAISTAHPPERLLIAVDGAMYAVAAAVPGEPPFEDAFEMGRQAQACLKSIYGELPGCFTHLVGPTPMWPTVYFAAGASASERQASPLDDREVVVRVAPSNLEELEPFLLETVNEADWAVVEHYAAMEGRGRFIRKDVDISRYLGECFGFHRDLCAERGFAPKRWFARHKLRTQLRDRLSLLYEAHADAAEIVNELRRATRESHESFSKTYFLAHCPDYTAHELRDCTEWDDSHVLQAARFLEDDLRASSLEQVTLTAALIAGGLGGVAGALVSRI